MASDIPNIEVCLNDISEYFITAFLGNVMVTYLHELKKNRKKERKLTCPHTT